MEERLTKKEAQNWLKCWLATYTTRDVIAQLADFGFKAFYTHIRSDMRAKHGILETNTCSSCSNPSKQCHLCSEIGNQIWDNHRFKKAKLKGPSWSNTDSTKWCTDYWELAKCYMPPTGYRDKPNADSTDFNGIIGAIFNCTWMQCFFTDDLSKDSNICTKAREEVNELRHLPDLPEINDGDTTSFFDCLLNLLNDPAHLNSFKPAVDARTYLKQLQHDTLPLSEKAVKSTLKKIYEDGKEGMTVIKQSQQALLQKDDVWISLAKHELEIATLISGNVEGVVTVLLLDISESMAEGEAWAQTETFVKDYLKGLQEVRSHEGSSSLEDEYVAIATFGHETRLQIHLTTDYDSVTDYIDHVRLGGPSPLFGGLWMAMVGALSCKGGCFTTNGILVVPKIIVISDYRPTKTLLFKGPDIPRAETIDESLTHILSTLDKINNRDISVFCVAVGDSKNDFVDVLKSIDKKVYTYSDGRRLSRRHFLSTKGGTFGMTSLMFDFRRLPNISSEDQEDMLNIRIESGGRIQKLRDRPDPRTLYSESTSTTLPKIGSRVRRGPDWPMTDDHDGNGPGTVVGHSEEVSRVWVMWDKDNKLVYPQKYGLHGLYDVIVTGEQRALKPGENIAVGCKVKPGPDGNLLGFHEWNTGIVIRIQPPTAHVRWDSGSRGDYSYGEDGKYEIEICTSTTGEASASGSTGPDESPYSDDATGVKPKQKNKNKK